MAKQNVIIIRDSEVGEEELEEEIQEEELFPVFQRHLGTK